MTPAEILSSAADLIERVGWCQGYDRMRNPKLLCLFDAVSRANRSSHYDAVIP